MSETGLLPAYLIVGTDGVKRDHAVSRMKARLEKTGMVEFNLDERPKIPISSRSSARSIPFPWVASFAW